MAKREACVLLLGLLGAQEPLAAAEVAVSAPTEAPLRCRLGNGPWQACRMVVDRDGLSWELRIGSERIRFRHDGRGSVTMRRGPHVWQPVEARWLADASLCWDGVCAQGPIPLD